MELDPGYSNVRVGVKALIYRDGHILFNEYGYPDDDARSPLVGDDIPPADSATNTSRSVFALPGGGQEHGESQVDALKRECLEEVGVRVRVFDLACTFELISTRVGTHRAARGDVFHQLNSAFWCQLEPGEEPSVGADADNFQIGVRWLPLERLHEYAVRPREVAQWLQANASNRPRTIGTLRD